MSFEQIVTLVTNNGFAIFVAVYYMMVTNKTMKMVTDALMQLSSAISLQNKIHQITTNNHSED